MNLIWAFLILGIVIFVHELGHFLVAKAMKVPVHKFAIGMGPRAISKTINETEYSIRWIPLGGFVQLELEEELDSEEGSAFRKLSIFKRASVFFAGALFNFIFAFIIILGISFISGYPSTTVGEVYNGSSAQKYGLQSGDVILSINGKEVNDWDIIPQLTNESKGNELTFKVKRDDVEKTIAITPELNKETGKYTIGITPEYEKDLFKAISSGIKSTFINIKATFDGLVDAFSGFIRPKVESDVELTGPIGTIHIIKEQTEQGFLPSIMLMVSLTISLGVFNLLPIPGLDGGKIFLLLIEFIRGGKQMSIDQELKVTMIGVFSLLALMVVTTFKDISNLF